MELLLEIVGEIASAGLELLFELALQLVLELLFDLGLEALRAPFRPKERRPAHPLAAGLGYALLGAIAGGLSLVALPHLALRNLRARVLNLILTPVIAGLGMSALGAWRRHHRQPTPRLERFGYGFVMALAMAAVRFTWGR